MPRIAYVNGRYAPFGDAQIHIEDRGYQFADAVYEVIPIAGGRMLDREGHLRRLARSLRELRIPAPMNDAALDVVIAEVVRRNRVRDGLVYAGLAWRRPARPCVSKPSVPPALVVTAKSVDMGFYAAAREKGIGVLAQPDIRWGRCDIKTTGLLPNVLAKQAARESGAYEAWLVDEKGFVTEGSSTNAWIVLDTGEAVTRPLDAHILPGVTRETLMRAAAERQLKIVERPFSLAEAKRASEAFLTAATAGVIPIVAIDGTPVGTGNPVQSRASSMRRTGRLPRRKPPGPAGHKPQKFLCCSAAPDPV